MTKCPKCGRAVPKKVWTMAGKSEKTEKKSDIKFGLCKNCSLIVILELNKSK